MDNQLKPRGSAQLNIDLKTKYFSLILTRVAKKYWCSKASSVMNMENIRNTAGYVVRT